jgi:hypothetical protein
MSTEPTQPEGRVYRLNLHQLRLLDEFIGVSGQEPRHIVSVSAIAEHHYKGLCPPLHYEGTPLDLTGAEITIFPIDEQFPESITDVLDAAFLPDAAISIPLPTAVFTQFVDRLRSHKILEAELLCEAYLDDPHHPKALHLRFQKLWLRFPSLVEKPRLTTLQIVLAIIYGMTLFEWTKELRADSQFMSWFVPFVGIGIVAYLFWPPQYVKLWRKNRRWSKEVAKRHAKWKEEDEKRQAK